MIIQDSQYNIGRINNSEKEDIGYSTQKPLTLLERIIKSPPNEGDLIADFTCGSGITAADLSEQPGHL